MFKIVNIKMIKKLYQIYFFIIMRRSIYILIYFRCQSKLGIIYLYIIKKIKNNFFYYLYIFIINTEV